MYLTPQSGVYIMGGRKMGFTFINKLPTPAEIREQFPLAPELAEIKHARDEEIKRVFTGESGKVCCHHRPLLS